MTALNPDKIPLDPTPLKPTHAFYISHQPKPNNRITKVYSLTASLAALYTQEKGGNVSEAHKLTLLGDERPKVAYTMKKENLFGTHLVARQGGEDGKEFAEWKSPFLSLSGGGTTKIKFLEGSPEGKGEVKVKLAGRRAESFVKDGVTYIWELEAHYHEHKMLYKVTDVPASEPPTQQKRIVADFIQPGPHNYDGLLVLDSGETDDLVAIITLCAVLEGPAREARADAIADMAFVGTMG